MSAGIVYVLSNEAMPGLVKIGYTTQPMEARLRDLYSTGVPLPFKCEYACHTRNIEELEQALHTAFAPDRVNPRREFFNIDINRVIPILEYCDCEQDSEAVTAAIQAALDSDVTEQDEAATRQFRKRRARFDFQEMGIPVGAEITYDDGTTQASAIVADGHQVTYNGEQWRMTPLTRKLRGVEYNENPLPYWQYNGSVLIDIYNETYPYI